MIWAAEVPVFLVRDFKKTNPNKTNPVSVIISSGLPGLSIGQTENKYSPSPKMDAFQLELLELRVLELLRKWVWSKIRDFDKAGQKKIRNFEDFENF